MNDVMVEVKGLVKIVKENRSGHQALFERAQIVYRGRMIEELDSMLSDAKKGLGIRRHISMPEPESHVLDYDRVLRMLELSIDDEIELDEQDFDRYVMDNWEWNRAFQTSTVAYLSQQ